MAISQQAIEYARKNPDDPVSKEIMRRTGGQVTPQPLGGLPGFATGFTKRAASYVAGGLKTIDTKITAPLQRTVASTIGKVSKRAGQSLQQSADENRIFRPGEFEAVQKDLSPDNTAEMIGGIGADIAAFLAPSSAVHKAQAVAGLTGRTLAATAGRAATEAALYGGGTAVRKGGVIDDEVKTAAIIAALIPVAGYGLSKGKEALGKTLVRGGESIKFRIIKPTIKDLQGVGARPKEAAKVFKQNMTKYKIGGDLDEMLYKSEQAIKERAAKLNSILADKGDDINLNEVFKKTQEALQSRGTKNFGMYSGIEKSLDGLKKEIIQAGGDAGKVNLQMAQFIKQAAGKKGAWAYKFPDPDAAATEKVYNTFYKVMKEQIEEVADKYGKGVIGNLNKEISDIIPIQQALLRRIPVAARQNAFGLTDNLAVMGAMFHPGALGILGANQLAKSGSFANLLVRAGQVLQGNSVPATALGKRFFGVAGGSSPRLSAGLSIEKVNPAVTQAISSHLTSAKQILKELPNAPVKDVISRAQINIVDQLARKGGTESVKTAIQKLSPAAFSTLDEFAAAVNNIAGASGSTLAGGAAAAGALLKGKGARSWAQFLRDRAIKKDDLEALRMYADDVFEKGIDKKEVSEKILSDVETKLLPRLDISPDLSRSKIAEKIAEILDGINYAKRQ